MFTIRVTFPRATLAVGLVAAVIGLTSYPRSAASANTSQDMPMSYGAMMKMEPVAVFHTMDRDKKGYVTRDGFMKFHQSMFDKMDKNKDGKLTEDEFLAHPQPGTGETPRAP